MNRIYQGRVSSLRFLTGEGTAQFVPIGDPITCPLWQHHAIFQDAVNYYLTALGAMADSCSDNRVIRELRVRLGESWSTFPGGQRDASSLRSSLQRTFPGQIAQDADINSAFDLILAGNEVDQETRTAALALLLAQCGGESAIQQGGRGYLPRLCDPAYTGSWDCDTTATSSATGKDKLAKVLHSDASDAELAAIAAQMDLSWTIKLQPGKTFAGNEAKARLKEAVNHLIKLVANPTERLAQALADYPGDPASLLDQHLAAIDQLPDTLEISRNRKAAPDLTYASIAFKHFPNALTQRLLRLGVKAPAKTAAARKTAKKAAAKTDIADFAFHGDDPIKLARGKRGYIFPAFTALPAWNPATPGAPRWKEFDIAAFKEALKALNQFNQKTIERDANLMKARHEYAYLIGQTTDAPKSDEGDDPPMRTLGTALWALIQDLENELSEHLSEGGWKLTTRSLRGFRDIRELWLKVKNPTVTTLQDIVKKYQADDKNRREIGSVQLFLMLAEERYHALWMESDGDDSEEDSTPSNHLRLAVQAHRLEEDIERFKQPIRLTPAEPRHSRRLFMFSDLSDKLAKVRFGETPDPATGRARSWVESAIALRKGGELLEARVRMEFSAPRLDRDELTGGSESRWLQPMTAALGFTNPKPLGKFDSACALMPDVDTKSNHIRHLLNFPVSLEPEWLHSALGKASAWKNQFNGTKDNNLHLHWPGTAKEATLKAAWWVNPKIIRDGFTLLSNDLGQRSAGAWALIKVTCARPETKRPCHSIGHDGSREWFAEILQTGMHRLPGEEQRVLMDGKWTTERYGSPGLPATSEAYAVAVGHARSLGCENPESWLGEQGGKSIPEMNDTLLTLAARRLTRLSTYHRWSCFKPDDQSDEIKRARMVEGQIAELAAYQDDDVKGLSELLKVGDFSNFRTLAGDLFADLRSDLSHILTEIANLVVPLRGRKWQWLVRGSDSVYGDLVAMADAGSHPKIRGQRGLSMGRLEQIEDLRRMFLRYNRSLDREPGDPAKIGREDRGRDSGEPCQELLEKIDNMKEQRVNQTAHLILAQALGVRLKPHGIDGAERDRRDLHGEYEKTPGREPVDLIVIEDLSRYRSSQGRAPSENSRLMKWAHRAIRDKLKMLAEEPFGIPLVEVVPAYSSRFHAGNGQAGARLHEENALSPYQLAGLEKLSNNKDKSPAMRAAATELSAQFKALELANDSRVKDKRKPHTLYYPKAGGPLFLAAKDGSPVQADTNAAANLGLRAIAAPECLAILRRVRAVKSEGVNWKARAENAREKAAFGKNNDIRLTAGASKKLAASSSPNFFYEPDGIVGFDAAEWNGHRLVSGVALWSTVNDAVFIRCAALNRARLEKWGILPVTSVSPLPSGDDSDDQIPI